MVGSRFRRFCRELNASDGVLQWTTFFEYSIGSAIAVDSNGNSYVAGQSFSGWGCRPTNCTCGHIPGGAANTTALSRN